MFRACDLEALPDAERDDCAMRLATSYLKEGNLRDASVWFLLLKEVSPRYQSDATYNLAYIDYVEKRYNKALDAFLSLKDDAIFIFSALLYRRDLFIAR